MSVTLTLKSFIVGRKSNESLMLRYAGSGDAKLLNHLYNACGDDLYHFVLTLSDPTLAKDICQKTWLKVIEKKHLYQPSGQFKAWLFTLARNQLIDEVRRNKKNLSDMQELLNNTPVAHPPLSSKIAMDFDAGLLSLPFEQREAFCLQQEGFSLQDISNITHSPIETVKSRVRYAKNTLRKTLERHNNSGEYHD